ncbi:hypothetical protein V6N13_113720 [Hibiscus sabdariffa]
MNRTVKLYSVLNEGKLFSNSESIQARAKASALLKQLHFLVDSLQKLLEKLEQSLGDIRLKTNDIDNVSMGI